MTDNILLYKIAQHAVFTWDLKLQNSYIEALTKVVRIMDKETPKGAELLDRMKAIFDLDEYELEEAMEEEG